MIDKEDIKEDLLKIFNKLKRLPTSKEYRKIGICATATVDKKFGNWNNALKEVFGITNIDGHGSQLVSCLTCNKIFKKLNSNIKRDPNHYCSRSCSATATNKFAIKRKRKIKCKTCDSLILSGWSYCKTCYSNKLFELSQRTIKECLNNKTGPNKFNIIRSHAKGFYKSSKQPRICANCNYDKHIEICHLKSISSFPETTTLLCEVNNLNNLKALCCNCHWEFDNGLLEINGIKAKETIENIEISTKEERNCKFCNTLTYNSKYCTSCFLSQGFAKKTLLQAIGISNGANKFGAVRGHARKIYQISNKPRCCKNCGYNKHIEICHIKDISSFTLDTLISKINHPDNLIAMCPNCHFEFDHIL
jgi:hypothetical protein